MGRFRASRKMGTMGLGKMGISSHFSFFRPPPPFPPISPHSPHFSISPIFPLVFGDWATFRFGDAGALGYHLRADKN